MLETFMIGALVMSSEVFVPRLYYFNIPGKAEASRLACAYAGVPLEDIRFSSRDEMVAMRDAGKLPFGQVPVLEVAEGTFIGQSAAIVRYLGKRSGLYPEDPIAAAVVDSIIDEEIDLFMGLSVSAYKERFGFGVLNDNEEMVMTIRRALNDEVLPRHLQFLENFASASTTGWIAGTEGPSIADFVLAPRLRWLVSGAQAGISTELLSGFPHLQGVVDRVFALPQVVEYYAQREAAGQK